MNSVSINESNGVTALAAAPSGAAGLGKDDFLKLLAVQLQYQDPLEPMENTEFVAQMAQFSSLEGITNMSKGLEKVSEQIMAMNGMNAAGLIGRDVRVSGDEVGVSGFAPVELGFSLSGPAQSAVVSVFDGGGVEVRRFALANLPAGENTLVWDAKGANGAPIAPGMYRFAVTAFDRGGLPIGARSTVLGTVSGVTYESGVPYLSVLGNRVGLGEVLEVRGF